MTDVLTKKQRSYNMSRIRSAGTKPELVLKNLMLKNKIKGWTFHPELAGSPDFAFKKHKVIIFVDGCFWHRCPGCFVEPKTRKKFWMKKINGNVERDKKISGILRAGGWTVLRFWEHQIRENQKWVMSKMRKMVVN